MLHIIAAKISGFTTKQLIAPVKSDAFERFNELLFQSKINSQLRNKNVRQLIMAIAKSKVKFSWFSSCLQIRIINIDLLY